MAVVLLSKFPVLSQSQIGFRTQAGVLIKYFHFHIYVLDFFR